MATKAIITCAITGAVHTPTMSVALPITPEQITTASLGAAEAGASIIHLHARDPANGRPTPDPDVFMQFLPEIKAKSNAILNITTGGSTRMTIEERLATPLRASPELCSLNLGSMNFVFSQMAAKYSSWKFDWEREYVEGSDDVIFRNTYRDIERILRDLGDGHGTRFEFECYDVSHLYTLADFADRGIAKPPFFVQMVFGVRGGIGAHASHLTHMNETAERLFGQDYLFSCRQITNIVRHAKCANGRKCSCRPGGQSLHRQRRVRGVQCAASQEDPKYSRSNRHRHCAT